MIKRVLKDAALLAYWHPFRMLVRALGHRQGYRLAGLLAGMQRLAGKSRADALAHEFNWLSDSGLPLAANREEAVADALNLHWLNEIDLLLYPSLNAHNIQRLTSINGRHHLDAALAKGRGAMLVFGHFGSNQMITAAIGHRGHTMSQLSAPPTVWPEKIPGRQFSAVERSCLALRWKHELALPAEHVSVFGSLKPVFRRLKTNGILGIAADGGGGAVRADVPFFGRRMRLSVGAAEIALRTGCAMLPAFMSRTRNGSCRLDIEADLKASENARSAAAPDLMAAFARRLEAHVLTRPGHYLAFMALRRFMESQQDPPLLTNTSHAQNQPLTHKIPLGSAPPSVNDDNGRQTTDPSPRQ